MIAIKSTNRKITHFIILIIVFFLGAIIRLGLVFRTNFPLNDGGFFYSAINDLVNNHFAIPLFVSYNLKQIPFAYPPLSFYMVGLLKVVGVDIIASMRFIPVVFNILSIPAFYLLSKKLLRSETQIIFSTIAFAILPPAYEWLIMGGGLTRSPAFLVTILAWYESLKILESKSYKNLFFTILLLSLGGLFHIEICMVAILCIMISMFFKSGVKFCFKYGSIMIAGLVVLTSPYWVTILINHGFSPIQSAFFSGDFDQIDSVTRFLVTNITSELLFTPFLVISFWGIAYCLQKRDYLLPVLILAIVIINPRSMERSVILPLCLLAGIGFESFLAPFIKLEEESILVNTTQAGLGVIRISWVGAVFIIYLVLRSAITSAVFISIPNGGLNFLTPEDRLAMQWIKQNSGSGEKILVLSDQDKWSMDYLSEWLPALAERHCVNTVQGSEWLGGRQFYLLRQIHEDFSKCLRQNLQCLERYQTTYILDYSMIYLSGKLSSDHGNITSYPIEMELRASPSYELIYENETVTIFALKN